MKNPQSDQNFSLMPFVHKGKHQNKVSISNKRLTLFLFDRVKILLSGHYINTDKMMMLENCFIYWGKVVASPDHGSFLVHRSFLLPQRVLFLCGLVLIS